MKFTYVKDNVLTPKECERLIKLFHINHGEFTPGVTQGSYDANKAWKDSTDWCKSFNTEDACDLILKEKLLELTDEYIEQHPGVANVGDEWSLDHKYNIQMYQPGGGFKGWHCEQGGWEDYPDSVSGTNRILVWMIYLNDVPDGGTMSLEQETIIEAVAGRAVICPAYWTHTHKSQISETQKKYIATGWYKFDLPSITN